MRTEVVELYVQNLDELEPFALHFQQPLCPPCFSLSQLLGASSLAATQNLGVEHGNTHALILMLACLSLSLSRSEALIFSRSMSWWDILAGVEMIGVV